MFEYSADDAQMLVHEKIRIFWKICYITKKSEILSSRVKLEGTAFGSVSKA